MPVCGSVGGGGASGIGMGYHGNVLLKTNVGEGEAEVESLIWWEKGGWGGRATDGTLLSIKGIRPVHVLDGCGPVLGHGGAEKIVGRGVWKEGMCQRLVLE